MDLSTRLSADRHGTTARGGAPARPGPDERGRSAPPPKPLVAVVPARAGSVGLPGKNTRLLGGRPLYWHSLECAVDAGIGRVVVTTDIDEILEAHLPKEVEAVRRPAGLASASATMAQVLDDLLATVLRGPATIVLLQPTSPLRTASDVQGALRLYASGRFDLVMSVCRTDAGFLKCGQLEDGRFLPVSSPAHCFANRQALPAMWRPNGAVYVFDAEDFRRTGGFPHARIGGYEMSAAASIDIDSEADCERCAAIMAQRSP